MAILRRSTGLQRSTTMDALGYGISLFVIIVCVAPVLWVAVSSFKTNYAILETPFAAPDSLSLENYAKAVRLSGIHRFFVNSFIVTIVSTAISLVFFSMSSYVLARCDFKLKALFFSMFISVMLIPRHAVIQPVWKLLQAVGLYDTRIGLILVYVGGGMAVGTFVLRSGFQNLPRSVEESAYIEGASFLTTFARVMLPMAKGPLVTMAVLLFMWRWNEFYYAFILTSSTAIRTVPVALRFFVSGLEFDYSALFAAITMALIPGLLVYAIFSEQITRGIAGSAVKG